MPKITFFSNGTDAGWSKSWLNELGFNEVLALQNPDGFPYIIIHEVAHLVCDKIFPRTKRHHGKEFMVIDYSLGGNGRVHHEFNTD